MTEITKKNRLLIAKFLSSEAGEDLRAHLRGLVPNVARSQHAHEMQFDAGAVQGWRSALDSLDRLSTMRTGEGGEVEEDTLSGN